MAEHVIMDAGGMRRTLVRLAHEIAERNENLNDVVLLGIKRGGEVVADRIRERLSEAEGIAVPSFGIDIGMQRDDLVSAFFVPDYTAERPDFSIENKIAVLCDDVLNTGRRRARGARSDLQNRTAAGNTAARADRPRGQGIADPRRFRGQKRPHFPQRIRRSVFYRAGRGGGQDRDRKGGRK